MLFDFRCRSCGELEEHWVGSDARNERCSKCGSVSDRVVSGTMPVLDPISGHFPGSTMKWARHHEKAAKKGSG
jgi:hypothetical protein